MVSYKLEVVASQSFVQAVKRLAECRTLSSKDHMAVFKICKTVQKAVDDVKMVYERKVDAELADKLRENCSFEGCVISHGAIAQAGLAVADVLAIENLFDGEEKWEVS